MCARSCRRTRAPVDPESGALSVGVPVFGTVVRVVDDNGRELPPGEIGEFVTSGPQVVSGYWKKPEHAIPGGQLHTGDVGCMDQDGWFYLVDLKKDQINVSGYKVWPRDVEDALYEHPAVREGAVVGIPDDCRGESVKAFVSLRPDAERIEAHDLIAFCRERMAAYKYPRQIEFIDELPETAAGGSRAGGPACTEREPSSRVWTPPLGCGRRFCASLKIATDERDRKLGEIVMISDHARGP